MDIRNYRFLQAADPPSWTNSTTQNLDKGPRADDNKDECC